ncbi:MAG: alpha-glucuronidase family glycosyl hydrolase, partial [Bryobacteraceae bacterium]
MRILTVFAALVLPCLAGGAFIARDGKAEAVIVSAEPNQYAATELRRYVETITGARLEIVAPGALRNGMLNIVVGGPLARKLAPIEDLKRDGFVLWRTKAGAYEVLVAAGNDDAATLYAVYDIIERFGATFVITKDILPEPVRDLRAPDVQLKIETPFPRRGLLISNIYPNRGIWHLNEVKAFLDQMAKMKMNYLQFFWFEHEPWIDFTYRGEHKLLGDATTKETGYMTWRYHYGSQLTKDIEVGREHFRGRERMAPAEFQHVETPEQAFRVAADFLREIIRYARTRHIKVWLCIDPTTLQGNHARFARRATNLQLPFHPILGTHMCPADPVLHEINAERVKALAETYPEAEGYILYLPEMYPDCPDLEDQALFA